MEDTWLAQHGLDRNKLAAMDPKKREKLLDQMKQDLQQKVQQDADAKAAGKKVDVTA